MLRQLNTPMYLRQVLLLGLVVAASAGKSTFGFYDEKRHG